MSQHIHFVTGRLARHALEVLLKQLANRMDFAYSIDELPISVAALMTCRWVGRHIEVPDGTDYVLLPGYCAGDMIELAERLNTPVRRGPRDLRRLPQYFGDEKMPTDDYGEYSIEILAEINHAARLPPDELLGLARALKQDGADVIDLGCQPGEIWTEVGDAVRRLVDEGLRVSIDSFEPSEVSDAAAAGAELVLSVNKSNREAAVDWGCEVVAIPDNLSILDSLDDTIDYLAKNNVSFRVDPILEPIGLGLANSLWRYFDVRRRYPEANMMMGVGNLTEMTDVDSAGVNVLLLGICQELGIQSVLTTQEINWARTSVKECDRARRLVRYAVAKRTPPKRVNDELVVLRDVTVDSFGDGELDRMATQIRDRNIRLFAERDQLHALSEQRRVVATDAFELFRQLEGSASKPMTSSHAFYLGFELAKASIAMTLGKQYRQDEALDWGYLTVDEQSHRGSRRD